jgi:DnaK suppressor protein
MKIAQEKRFKRILEVKRLELLREIKAQRERLTVERVGDPMDQVRIIADREFVLRNADRISATLRFVEGALGEIREGTFGICAQCGMDIPARRLQAVPWAPYCVTCQERKEPAGNRVEVYKSRYAIAS